MNKWTNETTEHNRTISTGPTPDGKIPDLLITVDYAEESAGGRLYRAIALDGHIIPLILRVPEMRDLLTDLELWIEANYEEFPAHVQAGELRQLIDRIRPLVQPTREELDALKNGA